MTRICRGLLCSESITSGAELCGQGLACLVYGVFVCALTLSHLVYKRLAYTESSCL